MNEALAAYLDVVVVNASNTALRLALKLRELPPVEQIKAFGGTRLCGYFYLFRGAEFPDKVYECIAVHLGDDAISSVYIDHRIFSSHGTLIAAREHLIRSIADKVGLSPEAIGIEDPARGRSVALKDLATGQLIDLLAEKMGKTIVTTNSHVVEAPV